MNYLVVKDTIRYEGSQLQSLFTYKNYGVMGDSVLVFRGPCRVGREEMVDMEDVRAEDWIFSEDMLHFIIEHFELDLEKTIVRQRLLIAMIKEKLEEYDISGLRRQGDDLYLGDRKLSVSISTLSPVSTLIHTGLNISSANTPIPTVSLRDLGVPDFLTFGEQVAAAYCQ